MPQNTASFLLSEQGIVLCKKKVGERREGWDGGRGGTAKIVAK